MIGYLAAAVGVLFLCLAVRIWLAYATVKTKVEHAKVTGQKPANNDVDDLRLRKNGVFVTFIAGVALLSWALMEARIFERTPGAANKPQTSSSPKIYIPSDSAATYEIISKGTAGGHSTIITRRTGSSGVTWSERAYDCARGTSMYLGTGDSYAKMKASAPDPGMTSVVSGSIADYVGREACR